MAKVKVPVRDGKAQLMSREGQLIAVPIEEAGQHIADGATPADPAAVDKFRSQREHSTLGQKAITAVEGLAEGATHGIGTAIATEFGGEEYRQDALARAEANPTLHATAGVVGAVGGSLLTGPARFLAAPVQASAALGRGAARLVPRLGTGAVGRALTTAGRLGVQGAVEGAAFGAGSSLAESALEGVDWTADSALAGMRDGAVYGLLGGAAIGGVGSLAGSAGRRVLESMTEGKGLRTAVQEFADGRILKGLSGNDAKFWRSITRNGTQPERIKELAKKLRDWGVTEADDKAGAIAAKLDESAAQLDDVVKRLDAAPVPDVDGIVAKPVRPNLGAMREEIGEQLKRLRSSGVASDIRIARQVEKQVEPFFAKHEAVPPTFGEVRTLKSRLGKAMGWHAQNKTIGAEEMQKLYGTVARNLDDAAGEAGPEMATLWKEANRNVDDLRTLTDAVRRKKIADTKNRFISPSDYGTAVPAGIVASMITGNPLVGAITTAVGSVAHKMMRERGSMALGRLANWAVETEQRTTTAARVIAGLEKAKEIPVRAFAKATSRAEIEKEYEAIEQAVTNPDEDAVLARVEKAIQPIAVEQPEVAAKMATTMFQDREWIKSKLPQKYGREGMTLTPGVEKPRARPADMKRVVSYAQALADPISVLEDFAKGNLDWDGIEALKERRPERFEQMRETIMIACAEAGRKLPYRKRCMLGTAFDFVSDPALYHTAELQAVWEARDAVPPTKPSGRSKGRGDASGMLETPFQQALAGE